MAFKVTWMFKGAGNTGWSEVWYDANAATQLAALTKADTQLKAARLGILCSVHSLIAIRASQVDNIRDSQVKSYSATQGAGLAPPGSLGVGDWGPGAQESFPTQVALLIRMEAGALNRRMFLARGVPLTMFDVNNVYSPTAASLAALAAFGTAFTGPSGYQLQTQTAGGAQFPTAVTIANSGLTVSIVLPNAAAPAGWAPGSIVRLSAMRGTYFLNGNWRIATIAPNLPVGSTTVTFFPKNRPIVTPPLNAGIAKLLTNTYVNYTASIPLRGGSRKTGRPFGLSRGRSRVRVY